MQKVNWGLIGCGDIARKRVAPALRDLSHCDLVAVSRAQFERAESFAKEFGARRWYGDWRELLADDEVAAVYVATPVHLHAEQSVAAAESGKHVLCEKPMALNSRDCDRMIEACKSNGVRLGVAYYRRFYPVVDRIRKILRSGEIGRGTVATVKAFEWFDPDPAHPRYWLLQKERSGGGPMFDFGCHRIELLMNLFGSVTEVRGLASKALFDREVEDTATAVLQFEDGPHAVLTVSHAAREPKDTLEIFGSEGSIHVASLNQGKLTVLGRDGERSETHPPNPNLHQPLIDDFARAVFEDREPQVDGGVGRDVARVVEAIYAGSSVLN